MFRNWFWLHLLVLLSTALTACKSPKRESGSTSLLRAAPLQSGLILETANLRKAYAELRGSELWKSLKGLGIRRTIEADQRQLQSLFRAARGQLRADQRFVICADERGMRTSALLFCTAAPELQLDSLVKALSAQYRFSSYPYDGQTLFSGKSRGKEPDFYCARYRGLFLFSSSKLLVEESIRQLNAGSALLAQKDFAFLYETRSNSAAANLFIQLKETDPLLRDAFPRYLQPQWQDLGTWAALDLHFGQEQCDVSGVLQVKDSSRQFLNRFKKAPASEDYARALIPANAAAYIFYALADYSAYYRHLEGEWNRENRLKRRRDTLRKWGIHPEALFSWVDQGLLNFYTFDSKTPQNNLVLPTDTPDEALEALAPYSQADETYRGYALFELKNPKLLEYAFGTRFSLPQAHYFATQRGLVFSRSTPVLKNLINQLIAHKTLGHSDAILKFRQQFAKACQVFLFTQNPQARRFLSPLLSREAARALKRQKRFDQIQFFGLQLKFSGPQAVLTAVLQNGKQREKSVESRWTCALEAPVARGPFAFTNYKTGLQQIAVQDQKNTLYLIDGSGKILWKQQLAEAMMGAPHEIDMYKNGKLQLAFNTPSELYVIARDGRAVAPFPISLREKATAPMGCFDYDKNRNYRLLIPEGDHFALYDGLGKAVPGFHFRPTWSYLNRAPRHSRIGEKDYLTATTRGGKILILHRDGHIRVKVDQTYKLSGQPLRLLQGRAPHWVTTTRTGALLSLYPNGKTRLSNLKLKPEHRFCVVDNGLVLLTHNALKRLGKDGFTYPTSGNPTHLSTGRVDGQTYYALTDRVSRQVTLLDRRGKPVGGFPVYGEGRALILNTDEDPAPELVVSTPKGKLILYGD